MTAAIDSEFEELYDNLVYARKRYRRSQIKYSRSLKKIARSNESIDRFLCNIPGHEKNAKRSSRYKTNSSSVGRIQPSNYRRAYRTLGILKDRLDTNIASSNSKFLLLECRRERLSNAWEEILEYVGIHSDYRDHVIIERNDIQLVTDFFFGGQSDNPLGKGHGHYIVSNKTGFVFYKREPNEDHGAYNYRSPTTV